MKLIDLVHKINEERLEELPLEIRYNGKLYTKKDAYYTYYEKGHLKSETLKIDTLDLNDDVEIVDKRLEEYEEKKEDVFDLCDKIRDILDKIEDLEDY